MGFGKEAEVIEPEHFRRAVAQELAATAEGYIPEPTAVMEKQADYRT
jgi:hypothetical protein